MNNNNLVIDKEDVKNAQDFADAIAVLDENYKSLYGTLDKVAEKLSETQSEKELKKVQDNLQKKEALVSNTNDDTEELLKKQLELMKKQLEIVKKINKERDDENKLLKKKLELKEKFLKAQELEIEKLKKEQELTKKNQKELSERIDQIHEQVKKNTDSEWDKIRSVIESLLTWLGVGLSTIIPKYWKQISEFFAKNYALLQTFAVTAVAAIANWIAALAPALVILGKILLAIAAVAAALVALFLLFKALSSLFEKLEESAQRTWSQSAAAIKLTQQRLNMPDPNNLDPKGIIEPTVTNIGSRLIIPGDEEWDNYYDKMDKLHGKTGELEEKYRKLVERFDEYVDKTRTFIDTNKEAGKSMDGLSQGTGKVQDSVSQAASGQNQLQDAIKETNKTMNDQKSAQDSLNGNLDNYNNKLKNSNTTMDAHKKGIDNLAKSQKNLNSVFPDSIKSFEDVKEAMKNSLSNYGLSESSIEKAKSIFDSMKPGEDFYQALDLVTKKGEKIPTLIYAIHDAFGNYNVGMHMLDTSLLKTETSQDKLNKSLINSQNLTGKNKDELKDYNKEQAKAADNTNAAAKEVKKYSQEHRDLADKLRMTATELDKAQKGVALAQRIFKGARDVIGELGIKVSENLNHALDAGEKGLDAFAKFLQGDFVGAAMAAVSAVISLGKILFSLFEGDGVGEAIDRERQMITISEEMEEKIRDLEETIGDTHAAISLLMDEIIQDAVINANNFENYAKRVGEIVLDLDRGHINLKEFQESMGKSWNALLEEAQNLGMEGSFQMLSVIRNMRNRGLEVAEIQEYVNEQIKVGIEAFNEYLATFGNVGEITDKIKELEEQLAETAVGTEEYIDLTTRLQEQHDLLANTISDVGVNFESMKLYAIGFIDALIAEGATFMEIMDAMDSALEALAQIAKDNGLEVTGALKEMLDMKEFINQNEEVVNRISTTIKMMEAFGNTSYLSNELFNQFQTDAQSHFDALIAKTDDAKMAYQLIGPELGKLLWYSQQYGYELDENTKKLIAEADQHGVNMKAMIPPQEKMVALLEELVLTLGGELPYAIDRFREHGVRGFGDIRGETGKWGKDLDDIEARLRNDLPDAADELDRRWQNNVSGNTILAENEKWENSLLYIRDLMGKELPQTAEELDGKYGHVIGDINEYLNITSVEGYKARLTFEQMGAELEQLHTAYAALAAQGKLTDNEKDVLADLERQINNLNQAMEDVIESYTNMDQLIRDAEITAQNFGSYVEQTGTIIDAMNQGILTTQEAQEALGKSFNALLDEAQQLGMEGSSQMLKLMQDIKTSGLEVAEVQEYINDQLKTGTDAFGKYLGTFSAGPELKEKMVGILDQLKTAKGPERAKLLEDLAELKGEFAVWQADVSANFDSMGAYAVGMFSSMIEEGATFIEAMQAMGPQLSQLSEIAKLSGEEVSGPLKEMLDMQDFIDQNETLVTRISATTEMMESLGNTGYLTSELFNTFQNDAQTQFDALMTKTNDATQAYQLMGPELAKLAWYSQQYGYELDAGTKSMIAQAQQHGVNMKAMIPPEEKMVALMESLVTVLGGDIPYAMDQMKGKTEKAFKDMKGETGEWKKELDKVEDKLKEDLKNAVTNLDNTYTDAMTGHSIVTETKKWKHSLEDVEDILGRELLETADSLDDKYKHVMGNIYEYLQKTSKEGYMNRMSFGQMVDELERLKNAHDKLALKKKRSDKENNIMDDYKRQITELSEAIEETAPTLENFGKKFEEFQDNLSGNIGVNRGMIEIARGLREQGQSLEEIDSIIEKSLSDGAKGLGAWVQALGPAEKELEDLKKLQEDYNELMEKEEKKEEDLLKLEQMRADIEKGKTAAQQSMLHDQNALLDSQDLMVAYFHSLQAEGKGVSEIMEIMGDSFEALAGKSLEDITGQPGIVMSETFSQLYEMQQKMGDNETLVKGIEGLGEALHGMGDSMLYMSDETFSSFEKSAVNAFQKLKESGFDQRQSLQLMAPLLHDLGSYAEEYGFSLSKSTRKMLEGAKEEGLIREKQKSDTEKLVEVNEHLALVMERMADSLENLGKVSPFAAMADEADELEKKTAQMQAYQRQQKTIERKIRTAKQDITLLEDELKLTGYESPETRASLEGQIAKKERDIRDMMKRQSWVMQLYDRTRLEVEELQAAFNSSLPPGGDYITAALGYHGILNKDRWFRLHEGERVDVWSPEETQRIMATPIKRMNLSDTRPSNRGGDIVFEHITIQSENGDEAVKEFMTAIKGNKYGVQNLIRKVAQ
jgi:chromosome segregation ATPase